MGAKKPGAKKRPGFFEKKLQSADKFLRARGYRTPWRRREALPETVSLIVLCHNVEKNLDDFFRSLFVQRSGLANVEIILVDDGSTEDTAAIIKKWQKRAPSNVSSVHLNGAGKAAALDAGLARATGEWVTFPDPSALLEITYLFHVGQAIRRGGVDLALISCNPVKSERDNKKNKDHPLKSRYSDADMGVKVSDLNGSLQISATTLFLRRSIIQQHAILFETESGKAFDDSGFISRYLKHCVKKLVIFSSAAQYLYSKSSDAAMSINTPPKVAAPVSLKIEEYARKNNLIIDRIANIEGLFEALISYLRENGCYIQTISSRVSQEKVIPFKYRDRDYVFNVMNGFEKDGIKILFLSPPKSFDHRSRIPFYFIGIGRCYAAFDFFLDPWLEDSSRVYTHSPNPIITSVPLIHINRTVSALHPYSLQGDPSSVISLSGMTGVEESVEQNFGFPIDLVYTWVDGADPAWIERKATRSHCELINHPENTSHTRFRTIDELRYSLRSVASFGKFVRNIFLVTDRQVPSWLNVHYPKITVIDHRDIFPEEGFLPTFNSHAIEANLYRIPGLAEHFLYMNDDVFFWSQARASDFFHANGLSKSFLEPLPNVYGAITHGTPAWRAAAINSNKLLFGKFGKRLHAHHLHTPFALRRSVFEQMWADFPEEYRKVSATPFRTRDDISPTSFLYHAYSFIQGQSTFELYKDRRFTLAAANFPSAITGALHDHSIKAACINDGHSEHHETNVIAFTKAMLAKYPVAAHWELDR